MTLLGNAKPTPEQLAEFRKNADKGRIWIYQNLEPGHADWGKLIFLQKPYAPPAQVTDPVDGTTWRYRLVGYILDLKTGEIGECRSTMRDPPLAPHKPKRKVIEGPWGKRTIEPPRESETPPAQGSGKGSYTRRGYLPADHWLYSSGPIVAGRAILQPNRKMTPEEAEKLLQDGHDAIARGNPKPTDND
jgi:hypothetical protein